MSNPAREGHLPLGLVTFLFTDIEDSTPLWEKHPEAMKSALAQHDALLRDAIQAHQGQIIKTTGDGVHADFATAIDGCLAALAAQRALRAAEALTTPEFSVRVRMGLHSGEAELAGQLDLYTFPNHPRRRHVSQSQPERATRLFAWVDDIREKTTNHRPPVEQASVDRDWAIIRSRVNDAEFAKLSAEGRAMTLEQAIAIALEKTHE